MYSRADVGPVDTFGVPTGADVAATRLVLVDMRKEVELVELPWRWMLLELVEGEVW